MLACPLKQFPKWEMYTMPANINLLMAAKYKFFSYNSNLLIFVYLLEV